MCEVRFFDGYVVIALVIFYTFIFGPLLNKISGGNYDDGGDEYLIRFCLFLASLGIYAIFFSNLLNC